MNSKRSLYAPASNEKVTSGPIRKTLAQGRLIQDKSENVDSTNQQKFSSLPKNPTSGFAKEHTPSALLDDTENRSTNTTSYSPKQEESQGNDPSTPRKGRPQISFTHSPRAEQPTRCLDISDTDSEITFNPRAQSSYRPEPTFSLLHGQSHTPVREAPPGGHYVSPDSGVRVSALYSNSRSESGMHEPQPPSSLPAPRMSLIDVVSNETREQHQSARPDDMAASRIGAMREVQVSLVREAEHPSPRDKEKTNCGVEEKKASGQVKATAVAQTKEGSQTPRSGRKKKAPRFVASRYMQSQPRADKSALGQSHHSSGGHHSTMNFTALSHRSSANSSSALQPKRTGNVTSRAGGALQPKRTGPVVKSSSSAPLQPKRTAPARSGSTSHSTKSAKAKPAASKAYVTKTPEVKIRAGKASTPNADSSVHAPEAVDISAIGPPKMHHHSSFNSPNLDDTAMSSYSKYGGATSRGARGMHTGPSLPACDLSTISSQDSAYISKSKARESQVTQMELDMLYARYLQWVFLNSSARNSFKQQQQQFMKESHALWEETERLREQESQLKRQVAAQRHANRLDTALDMQEAGLKGVGDNISEMRPQYNTLAAALDTTRHQIPTTGILIPPDEQHFHERLCEAVTETEQLLKELSVLCQTNAPSVIEMAKQVNSVHSAAQTQVSQLHRCKELLAAADSLSTRESSLRIQQL